MNTNGFAARWATIGLKMRAVARITARQQLVYKMDFVLRATFLLLILFVFAQLWTAAYAGDTEKTIAGFKLKEIVWYLVFTEAFTMAVPPLCARVEDEVKNGDIAIRLIRPFSYLGYHYSSFLAEAVIRLFIHLFVGSLIAWPIAGAPSFGQGWAGLAALSLGALTISFLLHAVVALCAFWVEEVRGMEFVLHKLQFTIGGMLMPIDLMPEWLQKVCAWLPFQAALYFPARTAVHFDGHVLLQEIGIQLGWVLLLVLAAMAIYRKGVKKLHANGG
ncbi:ABC transporter permease [Cohnella soli]|uniref:ABC transporter permease n=1 Tax=Cohnella soli TaxID=425005 RepID=A0ABW0HPM2_9BACL